MSKELQDDYKPNISNEEMVQLAKQQHEQKKVSDYKFPTEVITLPSNGLLYPKENPLSSGKVEMKYMTAKEEDILTTQSYIKDGTVLDRLLKSLLVGNGDGYSVKYDDLVVGDKNAIMIAARILGYGKIYSVDINDPFSGEKQHEEIDLTEFENKPYDGSSQVELNKNEFEFELPHSKRTIVFQLLTESKEKYIQRQLKNLKKTNRKVGDKTSKELTTRLKTMILSVDAETDKKYINDFVDNELFAVDSRAIRTHIKKVSPDIDLTFEFISDETGERRRLSMPMDVTFFWPES
jgi:hypothetical protein